MTQTLGVVGAGTMGAGIAQVALEAGWAVRLHDVVDGAVARGRDRIEDGLRRRATKAGEPDSWVDEHLARLSVVTDLAALASGDLVIEAAIEDLPAKQAIFAELDGMAPPSTILATNTSALSVTAIADAARRHPERVLGLHFFNPAPVLRLVEVVAGARTDPRVLDRATAIVEEWGKTPVHSTDSPGFIVNRVNRPFTIEALRLVEAGESSVEAIDGAMRAAGFPMGPFELMDLVGLDVNLAAATGVWEGLGRPDRLKPSPIQRRLVEAGALGRKTGLGFYRYAGGRPLGINPAFAAAGPADGEEIQLRIRRAIAAEAVLARDEGVASEPDIETALRLGAAHPEGPFEWLARRTIPPG